MRTKIICTIGPATESEEKIKELIEGGMDIARLNFSHNTHESHEKIIKLIRLQSKKLKKSIKILCDLQGPKIRTADFPNPPRVVYDGQKIILTNKTCAGLEPNCLVINDPYIHADVKPKDIILIDDGAIELIVEKTLDHQVFCQVIRGGDIYPRKGVNLPLTKTTTAALTEKDKKDLKFILKQKPDWIAISFVQNEDDILSLQKLLEKTDAKIMCKIERAKALENIDSIIRVADGIMVARGDLGVEMPIEKIPIIQKQIIKRCNYKGKPVTTATQMLSSMTDAPFPTRAEVSDIANAIYDGTDAVMLSNETAVGKYPILALKTMRKVIAATEDYIFHRENLL